MRLIWSAVKLVSYAIGFSGVTLFVLMKVFGLQIEMSGHGLGLPVVSFHDPDLHIEAIESRSAGPELAAAAGTGSTYWTDYRGPGRAGIYDETRILTDWPEQGLTELWRTKVGGGYASMVVAEGRVFTIEQRRKQEVVAAYDLSNGAQLWEHSWPGFFQEQMGGNGPRATPTWHEGQIYALGASGELRRLDAATGQKVWSKNILEDNGATNLMWGMSGAPLVVDDKLIVNPGGPGSNSIVAYDKDTGDEIWSSQGDPAGYASPQLATLDGKRQVLVMTGTRVVSLDVEDGALLWNVEWETDHQINAAQPLAVDEDHVWVSSGYGMGSGLLKISGANVEQVWKSNSMKNKFNSSVLYQGHVYGLDDAIFACIDVRTGERKWKGGRYGFGQVLLAAGHVIVLTEQGEVVLLKATPESHQELAKFSALSGKTWNVPAIAEGKLLVRNQTEMVAYDLAP